MVELPKMPSKKASAGLPDLPLMSKKKVDTELSGEISSTAGKSEDKKEDFISSLSFLDAASYGTGKLLLSGNKKVAKELTPEEKEYARVERVKRDALDEIVRSNAFLPFAPGYMKNTSFAGGVSKLASNAATALGAITEAAVNFADDIVNPKISLAASSGFGLEGFRQTDFDIAKAKEEYSKPRKKSSESVAGDLYNFGNVLNKLGDSYLRNSARSIGVKEENIGKGFTELIGQGENGDAFLNLGVQAFSQLPQVTALAATGGSATAVFAGSAALGTAASLGEEYDKDGDITASNAIKSIGKGIVEGVTETIFRTDIQAARQLGKSLFTLSGDATQEGLRALIKQEGKEAVKEALVRDTGQVFKKAFGGAFEEGIEEVLAATGSFVIDRLEDGKWNQKNFDQLLMDASDSFFIGAATGGFISGSSARMSMTPLTVAQQKKIEKFNEIANNEELSQDVRDIAKSKVNEIVKYSTDLAEKDYSLLARLPIAQRQEAFDILSKIKTIEDEKSELKDESLLEAAELTIDGYKTQVDSIIGANETKLYQEFRDALKTATEKDNEAVMAFLEENNILEQADQILAPVSPKVANREDIQDTVVNETTDKLYGLLELIDSNETLTPQQKLIASQPIDEEISKLEGYEFTAKYDTTETFTKETTRTTREVGRIERENARKTKVTADRFNGQYIRFTDENGNAINTIAKVDDSGTITLQEQPRLGKPAGKPIVVDSNFLEFQESKFDEDGNVVGAVLLDTSNNSTIQISNPELAMDLAIKAKQDKLGPISDAIFEQAVTEVLTGQELETTKEYINKNKAKQAAQQAQTEETEAPQTGVPTSPVGLPSRRAYIVEDDVETKKGNKILNKIAPEVKKRIANYVKALKATIPNSTVVLYDNKADMIDGLVNQGYSREYATNKVNESDGLFAGSSNTIHIDVMRMDKTTLPHEIFHPLVARLAKENPEEFIALRKRISKVLSASQLKELDDFAAQYSDEGKAVEGEEFMAQLGALVTTNKAKMKRGTLMELALAVKAFLKKIAAKTNSKALADFADSIFTEQTKTDDLIKFFEGFGKSLRQGEAINTDGIPSLSNKEITEQDVEDISNINEDFSGTLYEPTNLNITGTISSPVPNTGRQPQLKSSKRGGIQVLAHETIDRKDLVGKNYSVTMSDHTKVGEYVNERTGVRIDNLMGGVFYPYIKGVRDAGLAWASVTTKAAREMILNAQNQDFTVVYRMSRSTGSRGNHNFNDVAYEELIAPVKNSSVSEKEFLQQLNDKLNSVSGGKQLVAGKSFLNKHGKESNNKITVKEKNENGELVEVTSNRKEITSLDQLNEALKKESFGKRGSFWSTLMKDDWATKSTGTWYKFLEKHNVASIAEIVDGLAEFETDTANDHDVVSVIKLDKPEYDAKGNVKIYTTRQELVNEDKGIYFIDAPNHPSYPYVVKGQPVGLLNEFNNISDYFPIIKEWINSGRLNSPYKAVETMGRELISSRDTLRQKKSYPDAFEESRNEYLDKFKNTPKEVSRYLRKLLFERNINVKKAFEDAKLEFSLYTMYNKAGASMFGNLKFTEKFNEIYGDLSAEEIKLLDNFILLRRTVAIDTNFDNRKESRPEHPDHKDIDGVKTATNKESALSALEDYKDLLGVELYNKIYNSSDKYFKAFSDILKYKYENGLINKETYELYKDYNYSPRKFLQFMFGTSISEESKLTSNNFYQRGLALSKDELSKIQSGSTKGLFVDSAKLLHAAMIATEVRVASNLALKTLYNEGIPANLDFVKEVQYEKYQDGTIKINPDGSLKYIKTPDEGFRIVTFKENGIVKAFQLREDLAKEYFDEELFDKNSKAYKFAQIASGSNILRNMATGMNLAFFVTNIPVDALSQVQFSGIHDGASLGAPGQFASAIAGTLVKSGQLLPLEFGFKNKAIEDLIYEYGKAGGLMMTLTEEYSSKAKFLGNIPKYLGSFGNASEMGSKLNAYEKVRNEEIKKYKEQNGKEPIGEDLTKIQTKAAYIARAAMDYHRGGTLTKWIDGFIPYLNVLSQATKITADYIVKNPKDFTNKITQMGIFVVGLTIYNLMVAGDDYDNDDNEQDLLTKIVIFSPFKDADGKRGKIEIGAPDMVKKFLNIFQSIGEGIYYQAILGEKQKTDEWKIAKRAQYLSAFDLTLPSNIPPALKAMVEYKYNLDLWRNKDITKQLGDVLPQDEGRYNPSVASFYKIIGSSTGMSPIRLQKASENFITQSNPLVGIGYSLMDKMVNNYANLPESQRSKYDKGNISDIPVAAFDKIAGRLYSKTDPTVTYTKGKDIIDRINQTAGSKKQEVKAEMKLLVEKKASVQELNEFLIKQDPIYRKAAGEYRNMLQKRASLNYPDFQEKYYDIMLGQNAEAKAQIVYTYFPYILNKGNEKLVQDLNKLNLVGKDTKVYLNKYVKEKGIKE
jgi:hypothetical protein